jgi:hypothetical protein
VLPAAILAAFLVGAIGDDYAFDFRQFWQGGRDVLDGVSPYPTEQALDRAGEGLDAHGIQEVFKFPYPAGSALAMVPFGALPFGVAAGVLTVLLVAATLGALWLLGVRDWRCYGVTFAAITTLGAIRLGTFTPLLVLGLAVAWRFRRDWRVAGGALAGCIVLKVFLWPVVAWLVATRRYAAAALAAGGAAVATLLAWAALGFDGLSEYPELLRKLTDVVEDRGYSLVALGTSVGLGEPVARALPWLAGGAVLAAAVAIARREEGDRRSFSLAVLAAVLLTPIVWLHYFLLLVVPIALLRPRLAAVWFLPLVLWLTPFQETDGELWRIALALGALAAVALLAAGLRRPGLPAAVGRADARSRAAA